MNELYLPLTGCECVLLWEWLVLTGYISCDFEHIRYVLQNTFLGYLKIPQENKQQYKLCNEGEGNAITSSRDDKCNSTY